MRLLTLGMQMTIAFESPKNDNNLLVTQHGTTNYARFTTLASMPNDSGWGIDTSFLYYPVDVSNLYPNDPFWVSEETRNFHDSGKAYSCFVGSIRMEHANIRVEFEPEYSRVKLKFNASRLLQPKSTYLLPPNAFQALVGAILDELASVAPPVFDVLNSVTGEIERAENWAEQVKVSRLDLARNIFVPTPYLNQVKLAVENTVARNQKLQQIYRSQNSDWTAVNSTKTAGQDRLYDKWAELQNHEIDEALRASQGTLRFETQLQKDRLETFGLRTLASITDERAWNAIASRWNACRWGVSVGEPNSLFAAVSSLKPSARLGVVGFMLYAAQRELDAFTNQQKRTFVSRAKSCGLTPGMPIELSGTPVAFLDINTGGLVDL